LLPGGATTSWTENRCRGCWGSHAASRPTSAAPLWGLHQLDVNLGLGDAVQLVDSEAKAYLARGPG
jgi:hypothetical protein